MKCQEVQERCLCPFSGHSFQDKATNTFSVGMKSNREHLNSEENKSCVGSWECLFLGFQLGCVFIFSRIDTWNIHGKRLDSAEFGYSLFGGEVTKVAKTIAFPLTLQRPLKPDPGILEVSVASAGALCSLEILVWGRKHLGNMLQPHLPCSRQTLLTGPALPQYLRPSPAILSIALSTAEIKRQDLTCQDNLIPPHKRTTSLSFQWCRNQSCLC